MKDYKSDPRYIELLGMSRGELEDKRLELNGSLAEKRKATSAATYKAKVAEAEVDAALLAEDLVTDELRLVFRAIEQQQADQRGERDAERARARGQRD